jgi:hypothetical protein
MMKAIEHNHITLWAVASKAAAEKICSKTIYLSQQSAEEACQQINAEYQPDVLPENRIQMFKVFIINGLISALEEQKPFMQAQDMLAEYHPEASVEALIAQDPDLKGALASIELTEPSILCSGETIELIADIINPIFKLDRMEAGAQLQKANAEQLREPLPAGTKISWMDLEAEVIEDKGQKTLWVFDSNGEKAQWAWELDGVACTVLPSVTQ